MEQKLFNCINLRTLIDNKEFLDQFESAGSSIMDLQNKSD